MEYGIHDIDIDIEDLTLPELTHIQIDKNDLKGSAVRVFEAGEKHGIVLLANKGIVTYDNFMDVYGETPLAETYIEEGCYTLGQAIHLKLGRNTFFKTTKQEFLGMVTPMSHRIFGQDILTLRPVNGLHFFAADFFQGIHLVTPRENITTHEFVPRLIVINNRNQEVRTDLRKVFYNLLAPRLGKWEKANTGINEVTSLHIAYLLERD